MEQLSVDGVHAEVAGTGPPVVLTHDGLTHGEAWDVQVAAWSADHRVACWDRRGYARSPRPATRFSNVDDLAAVVRAVSGDLERPLRVPALARLGEISVPALIVVGEQDIPDVHAHSGAIEAGIPGATRVVLPGSGHLPHLEVPDAFDRLVREFLTTG
jgi:pimeloyl-ACP methyl ester carboxylesterase